jgi:hypothetical protein
VVWTGSEYGVSWTDDRTLNYEIHFARLHPDGTKLTSDELITADDNDESNGPVLLWSGSEYGVSWWDDRGSSYDIYFARISGAGAKIGSDSLVSDSAYESRWHAMAWATSQYGIAMYQRHGDEDVYFSRLLADGSKQGPDVEVADHPNLSDSPAIAWSGSEFGIVWVDGRTVDELWFARMSGSGIKQGSDVQISFIGAEATCFPSLVWTGSEFGVAWINMGAIYFARFTPVGSKIGGDLIVTSSSDRCPSMVWTGSEFGIGWYSSRGGLENIYFNRIAYCE